MRTRRKLAPNGKYRFNYYLLRNHSSGSKFASKNQGVSRSKFLSFKIVISTLRTKSAKEMWILGLLGSILKFFAVRTLHVGFSLDHSSAFLLFSDLFWARDSSKKRRPEMVRRSGKASGPEFEQSRAGQWRSLKLQLYSE
jgi:hypothetical protein